MVAPSVNRAADGFDDLSTFQSRYSPMRSNSMSSARELSTSSERRRATRPPMWGRPAVVLETSWAQANRHCPPDDFTGPCGFFSSTPKVRQPLASWPLSRFLSFFCRSSPSVSKRYRSSNATESFATRRSGPT